MSAHLSKAQIGRIMDAFLERGEKVCEVRCLVTGEIRFLTEEVVKTSMEADPIEDEIATLRARYGQD